MAVLHRCHAVRVGMRVRVSSHVRIARHAIHNQIRDALLLRYRAILMCEEDGLQIDNFFPQLLDLGRESVIF